MTELGERITEARYKKNMSVGQVAIKARMSIGTLRNVIYGKSSPRIDTLITIADALDVSLDYLVGRKEQDNARGQVEDN